MLRMAFQCMWIENLSFENNPYFFAEIAIFCILVHGLSEVISAWSDISASKGDIEILVDKSLHLVVFSMPLHCWSHARIVGGAYCFRMWLILAICAKISQKSHFFEMFDFFPNAKIQFLITKKQRGSVI